MIARFGMESVLEIVDRDIMEDTDTLARTLWGEARGESHNGRIAVANVILNRLAFSKEKKGYWWGNSIEAICLKPWQFSCWNANDPNYEKLKSVTDDDDVFRDCLEIAERAVSGGLEDLTDGATHYHVASQSFPEAWGEPVEPHFSLGRHLFYKGIA